MTPTYDDLWNHRALRPLTPVVLAAWQDSHLSPAELLFVRETLERSPFLDAGARQALSLWLNPAAPPPPAALRALSRRMREFLRELPKRERHSMLAMGAALAGGQAPSLATQSALATVAATAPMFRFSDFQSATPQRKARTPIAGPRAGHSPINVDAVRSMLDGSGAASRARVRQLLAADTRFRSVQGQDTEAQRAQVLAWLKGLYEAGIVEHCYPNGLTGGRDLQRFAAVFETLATFDLSLVVKFGVQAGLFAGAIETLGSAAHHPELNAALRGDLLGCFAMTERGHGSNVRDLRTTAEYDADRQEFVIHTAGLSAGKEWIGNAARDGRAAVVFAQLHAAGEDHGVHAFIVPIRNSAGEPCEGVRIEDCGTKMGLNGVDNGRLWFDQVRVPRTALLDRFGQVTPEGHYHSDIPSSGKRFFSMLSTLVGGRIAVAGAATSASKVGLAIAVRYGSARTQFPDDEGREMPLMHYPSHRNRLLPRLAAAYAYTFAQQALVRAASRELEPTPEAPESGARLPEAGHDVDTLAAGVKALATWHAIDTLQQCRECCGGQGYLTVNRIDALRTDTDVFTTFEGDNTVLLSLVASNLLRTTQRALSRSPVRTLLDATRARARQAIHFELPIVGRGNTTLDQPQTLLALLRLREQRLRLALMARIFVRTRGGMGVQEAFDECQSHALALARAYTEHFVFDSFVAAAEQDPQLVPLCRLHGLWRISEDLPYFLAEGVLSPGAISDIREQLRGVTDEVAEHALEWVTAFAIPDVCLGPLADAAYLESSGLSDDAHAAAEAAREAAE